jgi:hypothetical protein
VDGGRYEIVRRGRHAWRFRLADLETGEDACEYAPAVAQSERALADLGLEE